VAVLAWVHGRAVAKGGDLLLVIPASGAVLRVFALAGIDRLIPSFADLNQALKQAHAVVPRPCTGVPRYPPRPANQMPNSACCTNGARIGSTPILGTSARQQP
jgi:hypothetical protein